MRTFRVLSLMLLALIIPSLLLAQHPLSGDLRVNLDTGDAHRFPHLATNPSGEFVVTWVSAHPSGDGSSLFAVRFNANGTPATGEILVSDHAQDLAANSALALMDDGSFVVVFPKLDGATSTLAARWYAPNGDPEGSDVLVTRNGSPSFSVSTQGDGGFVVAWEGNTPSAWTRVFGSDHSSGPETLIDPRGTDPVVAVGPQGGFVVAWKSGGIVARRFTALGTPAGRRFVVDSGLTGGGAANTLHIGKQDDGSFLILWGTGPVVFGRRYNSDATPIGGLLRLQAGTGYDAAIGGKGNFVLVWEVPDSGTEGGTNVFARRFGADGASFGPLFRVNLHARGSQELPHVGIGADGGFVVVWQSRPDATSSDIFARRFQRN